MSDCRKYNKEVNVYDATQERIKWTFDNFEQVMISFSGGKDSSVCLNLYYDYAKEHGLLDRLAMYHLDYEAQYQATTDFVTETFKDFDGIKKYWLCLPIEAQCCCRLDSSHWTPWEKSKREIWVRDFPQSEYLITEDNAPFHVEYGLTDNQMQDCFNKWFASKYGKTAVIIGIRASESYSRYQLVTSGSDSLIIHRIENKRWTVEDGDVCRVYPIYDWELNDVWTYFGKYDKKYNKLYDLYYKSGMKISQMRVASPFNHQANATLKFYKVIDPNMWGKMVSRVNGVNFVGLYGDTKLMGWKNIQKPSNFTWKEYFYFLISVYPKDVQKHYLDKIEVSKKSWNSQHGGACDEQTIRELLEEGSPITVTEPKSNSKKRIVHFEDYLDDTNVTDFKRIPTWKRACVCVLKNDFDMKYMGFSISKTEMAKRAKAMEKYRNL